VGIGPRAFLRERGPVDDKDRKALEEARRRELETAEAARRAELEKARKDLDSQS